MDGVADASRRSDIAGALATIIANLPAPVREFVNGPDRDRVSLELMQKYRLHADEAGEFERAYIRMLLGIDTPDEFILSLRQAGIPDQSISGLINDVNEMVFIPLRRKEREMSEPQPEPKPSAAPPPPPAAIPASPPAPLPPQTPSAPTYMPPIPGSQQQVYWVPVSITAVPQPYMTTQPPVGYQAPQPVPAPEPVQPPPPVQAYEVPRVEERPAPPPPPMPTWEPAPPPNLPIGEAGHVPLTKDYAADPYREPV